MSMAHFHQVEERMVDRGAGGRGMDGVRREGRGKVSREGQMKRSAEREDEDEREIRKEEGNGRPKEGERVEQRKSY